MPNVANTLCLAAKAWSDACYLDEIQGPFREHLTMQDRHEVNKKAIEYARQVDHPTKLTLPQGVGSSHTQVPVCVATLLSCNSFGSIQAHFNPAACKSVFKTYMGVICDCLMLLLW